MENTPQGSSIFDTVERAGAEEIKDNRAPTTNTRRFDEDKVYVGKDLDVNALKLNNKRFACFANVEVSEKARENLKTIAGKLAEKGFVLRAEASDRNTLESIIFPTFAFKEIFMTYAGFNKMVTPMIPKPSDTAYSYAIWLMMKMKRDSTVETFNGFDFRRQGFMARNMHIYLGEELNIPIDFAIIYSECGLTELKRDMQQDDWKKLGYECSRVIRESKILNRKVYNVGNEESVNELLEAIKTF